MRNAIEARIRSSGSATQAALFYHQNEAMLKIKGRTTASITGPGGAYYNNVLAALLPAMRTAVDRPLSEWLAYLDTVDVDDLLLPSDFTVVLTGLDKRNNAQQADIYLNGTLLLTLQPRKGKATRIKHTEPARPPTMDTVRLDTPLATCPYLSHLALGALLVDSWCISTFLQDAARINTVWHPSLAALVAAKDHTYTSWNRALRALR